MFINTLTLEYPVSYGQLREKTPDSSLPLHLTDADLVPLGHAEVTPAPQPDFDKGTHKCAETPPVFSGGKWVQQWSVTALDESELRLLTPTSVSPRQIRQALTRVGLRASLEAAVAAADQDTKDWYEFAVAFERNNPRVLSMGAALSVSGAQLDALWTLAGSL